MFDESTYSIDGNTNNLSDGDIVTVGVNKALVDAKTQQNSEIPINHYKDFTTETNTEFVQYNKLSSDTLEQLGEPLV